MLLVDNAPGPQSSGDVMRFLLSSMLLTSLLQPSGSRVTPTFKSYFRKHISLGFMASTDSDIPLTDPEAEIQPKAFRRGFTTLAVIQSKGSNVPTLTGVWKMTPTLMHDSEAFKTSVEGFPGDSVVKFACQCRGHRCNP